MKKNLGDSLIESMNQALSHAKGEKLKDVKTRRVTISPLPHYKGEKVKDIRKSLHLTQKVFALVLGVSIKTVEAWEAGKNEPSGAAQRLLDIFHRDGTVLEKFNILSIE